MELDAAAASPALPDDERLDSATLLGFTLDKLASRLYLKIRIRSIAGDDRTIYLPVPIVIK